MLPAGMFLVWSCHNACRNMVHSKWAVSLLPYWWNILKRISHTSLYSQGSVFFKACVFQEFARFHQQNLPFLALDVLMLGSYELFNVNYTQLALKVKFFFSKKTIVSANRGYKSGFFEHSETERCGVSAVGNRTLLTYSSVSSVSPFNFLRLRVTF